MRRKTLRDEFGEAATVARFGQIEVIAYDAAKGRLACVRGPHDDWGVRMTAANARTLAALLLRFAETGDVRPEATDA